MHKDREPPFHDPDQLGFTIGPEPRARTTDPDTSHEAAASMFDEAESQRLRILVCLEYYGAMTADFLDEALDLRPTSAGRRLPELEEAGLVTPTGDKALTRSGRKARLWRVVR